MATETQDIVLSAEEPKEEIVESEKKVEYSVKSEVISTVKTHETVTLVTEVRSESETVENHVQESTVETTQEVIVVENGKEEEKEEEPKEEESAKPSDNVESPASDEPQQAEANVVTEANVAAEADVVADETPADESKAEANEPVVEVEEEQPKVILHQLPPVKEIVSRSPQCLALETFILMCEIPYAKEYEDKAQDVTKENKGKIPYIVYKKDKVEGLKNCIDFLMKEFAVETDKHLSPPDLAVVHAFRTMMEESTYWSLMYYRWVDNYGESKKVFSKLPPVLNVVSPKMFQNKCKKSIESHVIGRYNREELYNIAEQDLYALSYFLGEKPFFLGEQPSSFDAIAFGLLANFEYGALGSPQNTLIQEKLANIREFNERMKTKFWSNWEEICGDEKLQEKPKTSLVKRLSFRGNKKSKKPAKEGEKSETTSPSNESKDEANGDEAKENGEEAKENGQESKENGQESKEKDEEVNENGDAEEPPKENGETEPTGEATSGEDKKEDGDQKGEINGETEPANADKSGGEEKE